MRVNFRNIEKDFATIVGKPGRSGEIGTLITTEWRLADIELSSDLDVYRDRLYYNPEKYDRVNFDWNFHVYVPLTEYSNLRSTVYYIYSPELLSPTRNLRLHNTYYRHFDFFNEPFFVAYPDLLCSNLRFQDLKGLAVALIPTHKNV